MDTQSNKRMKGMMDTQPNKRGKIIAAIGSGFW